MCIVVVYFDSDIQNTYQCIDASWYLSSFDANYITKPLRYKQQQHTLRHINPDDHDRSLSILNGDHISFREVVILRTTSTSCYSRTVTFVLTHHGRMSFILWATRAGCLTIWQRLLLSIKAELENVTDLAPSSDDFEFFFQVRSHCLVCPLYPIINLCRWNAIAVTKYTQNLLESTEL